MITVSGGLPIFIPQRVLSYEDKSVTGFFLGSEDKSIIEIKGDAMEDLMRLPIGKNATNDFQSVVIQTGQDDIVLGGIGKALIQCESKQTGNIVHVYKTSLVQDFDMPSGDKMKEFIIKNTHDVNDVNQKVQVDIDGTVVLVGSYDDLKLDGKTYLNASVMPVLELESSNYVSVSKYGLSLLVLNLDKFTCLERFELETDDKKGSGSAKEDKKVLGIERYFNELSAH